MLKTEYVYDKSNGKILAEYDYVNADKSLVKNMSDDSFREFSFYIVGHSGKEGRDWMTINFDDGTGITFPKCMTGICAYGTLDENNMAADTQDQNGNVIKKVVTINLNEEKINLAKVLK